MSMTGITTITPLPRCGCKCGCNNLVLGSKYEKFNGTPVCKKCGREAHDGVHDPSTLDKRMALLKNPYYTPIPQEDGSRMPRLYYGITHVDWVIGRVYGEGVSGYLIQQKLSEFIKTSGMIQKLDEMQNDIDQFIIAALDEYLEQQKQYN